MDFSLSEDQESLRLLAERIFWDRAGAGRLKEVEASSDRIDRDLWSDLAGAGILGVALPPDAGGSGLGLVEVCLVLEQQGRRTAPVPLLPTLVGALALARDGRAEARRRWLPAVTSGDAVLSVALSEPGAGDPLRPETVAGRSGSGWSISGTKLSVPAGHVADRILVPARVGDGVGLFLVDPRGPGAWVERAETTDRQLVAHLVMRDAPVDGAGVIGEAGGGRDIVAWVSEVALVAWCAVQLGVTEEALSLTAAYVAERQQFGRPLATNQAVAQRAADAYIDVEAIRATMWQAAWRLSEGVDATVAVLVAKWWASEAGQRVVHSAQHLHGGMGADVDYPVHRYFLWGKQIEDTLGGPSQQLARLGRVLVETGATGR